MKKESAGAMLVAARENEAVQKCRADAKARAADFVKAMRTELVACAASGAEMDAAALMQAEHDARLAGAEAEIADAIYRGAEKQRCEAEVFAWFDKAEQLRNAVEEGLNERFAAAAAVDLCLADLDRAVSRFNDAGLKFSSARTAAANFTAERDLRIGSNPILAAMPAGTHPNAKNSYGAEVCKVAAAIFDASGGMELRAPIKSLAQRERFLWGRKPMAAAASRAGIRS